MKKIAIVDDHEDVRNSIKKILENEYIIYEASNGKGAIELFENEEIDLFIIDIIMPEKEGIETIMELMDADPDVNIIAISGGLNFNPGNYLNWAKQIGVKYTFAKPFDPEIMIEAIKKLIG